MTTPKEYFIVSGHATEFGKMASTEQFSVACDYALLQLVSELAPNTMPGMPTDALVGFDANAQRTGAARVLAILKTLHQPNTPKPQPKRETLNYA